MNNFASESRTLRCGMWLYPAKYFQAVHPARVHWMLQHAPYLGDDEVCAMLFAHVFDFNIVSMRDSFGVTLGQGQHGGTLVHGKFYPPILPVLPKTKENAHEKTHVLPTHVYRPHRRVF